MKSTLKKSLFVLVLLCSPILGFTQTSDKPKPNWQNLDLKADGAFGISTEKAYRALDKRQGQPVVVAVIDGGIDIAHEDLKDIIWTNTKEIAANGKDDDGNGYVDDVHGWSFIGSAKGNIQYDNMELVRLIRKLKPKYESALNSTPFSPEERKEFELYQRLVTDYMAQLEEAQNNLNGIGFFRKSLNKILSKMNNYAPSMSDFERYAATDEVEREVIKSVKSALKEDPEFKKFYDEMEEAYVHFYNKVNYQLNMDYVKFVELKDLKI